MKVVIDRFEENCAVVELENRETVNLPKALVPKEAKEGDVLDIEVNETATRERKREVEDRLKNLWENS